MAEVNVPIAAYRKGVGLQIRWFPLFKLFPVSMYKITDNTMIQIPTITHQFNVIQLNTSVKVLLVNYTYKIVTTTMHFTVNHLDAYLKLHHDAHTLNVKL